LRGIGLNAEEGGEKKKQAVATQVRHAYRKGAERKAV